ncbi:MAG TPA: patatin-like phospholipase family protein [Jatrophihabitantaceae bacterium]
MTRPPGTAFVLGGGGLLGASQVGMLRALFEDGIRPDLVLGTSVGAVNGVFVAADPGPAAVERLAELWASLSRSGVFAGSLFSRAMSLARHGTHLHPAEPLHALLRANLPVRRIEELTVPFQCVAASIERAGAHWFTNGPITDAVPASCAVPGLLPPAKVDGEHFFDGGLVDSIPVGRAMQLGAREIYVLHVGRVERPLRVPRWPWEVGLVAFEIARRHRFVEAMNSLSDEHRVHVLPAGDPWAPLVRVRYNDTRRVGARIDAAYEASRQFLDRAQAPR